MPEILNSEAKLIAFEWLRHHELSSLSPVETYLKYKEACQQIQDEIHKNSSPQRITI